MRLKNPLNGFKYAIEGVAHVFRTQRHMRFHFLALVLVLLFGLVLRQNRVETLILLFTVTLVLVTEMFNTAVEAVVDLVTQTYHPLAKFAKDIAAGAVLIAVTNAFIVAFLVYFNRGNWPDISRLGLHEPSWPTIVAVGFILLAVLVTMWKFGGRKGKFWRGGVVSAHTALGFFFCITILFVSKSIAAAVLAFMMAVLLAQSRVEAGIHSIKEVVTGALLALVLSAAVYWFIVPR